MGDLISRSALKEEIERNFDMQDLYLPCHFFDLIDDAPTVELFCSYLSDGEVREPCVEAPCSHARPQGKTRPKFSDIKTGEVFAWESNIYIKTSKLKSELANAVRLATGDWVRFDESTPVNRVNAEVVVRYDED